MNTKEIKLRPFTDEADLKRKTLQEGRTVVMTLVPKR